MLVLKNVDRRSSFFQLLDICFQNSEVFTLTKNRWQMGSEYDDSSNILCVLSPYLITTIHTSHWFSNYVPECSPLEVYLFQVNDQTKKVVLEEYDRLFSGETYFRKPEDICFFENGTLVLGTVLHEKICFAYKEDESFVSLLKQVGQWEFQADKVDEQILIHSIGRE